MKNPISLIKYLWTYRNNLKNITNELHWIRGYVRELEEGIECISEIVNESSGVCGSKSCEKIETWTPLLEDSPFDFAKKAIEDKRQYDEDDNKLVLDKLRPAFYIKEYRNMPMGIAYVPVYGGVKYVRETIK